MVASINQKSYIVDASFMLARILNDEQLPVNLDIIYNKFVAQEVDFIAPQLLQYEIGNNLKTSILRKINTVLQARDTLRAFLTLDIRYINLKIETIFNYSIKYNLSFYDASYFALSQKLHLPLLTLDKKLASLTC